MKSCSFITICTRDVVFDQLVGLIVVSITGADTNLDLIFGGVLSDGHMTGAGGANYIITQQKQKYVNFIFT